MAQEGLVYDVGAGEFDRKVIAASSQATVVVDLWAPWCAPCRVLGPVLERVVQSMGGRVRLARVNIEENREIAARFGVQSIPAVKIFRDGKVVAEFVGALPEPQVRRIIEDVVPSAADELVAEGDRRLADGDRAGARRRYEKAMAGAPTHAGAALRLARLALEDGQAQEARRLASLVGEDADEHEEASALLARLDFAERCQAAGGLEACRKRAEQDPADLGAHYDLACCLAAQGDYGEAMEELLKIIAADKRYGDDLARKTMLRIFAIVGKRSPLADEYRDRLARLLY